MLYAPYYPIVFLSTTLSAAWHFKNEPIGTLMYLDYLFAGLWMCAECVYTSNLYATLGLNLVVFVTNKVVDTSHSYALHHSAWHILSATKSIVVAKYLCVGV